MAYSTMKGVMIPGVSAGSNQVGARETCTAHVAWPSGAAVAAGGEGKAARTTAARAAARAVRRMRRGPIITVSSMRRTSERSRAWDLA